ncbi:O-glucosyltransferase rumi homolog isoform X3 [Aethina tumida]|uniref:O-glucosyltransferase rumi homolog isoform X2 n=1 Tax=Aethina tumida TaxID=116153 RepID=UPI0021483729|nr:O-glucosyltransferase rumi homolog isoform X2 [Aethina tumida]XP_049822159.1 O-glucosyltransferase rumi homolog isoform X3 [Aethina tumida]
MLIFHRVLFFVCLFIFIQNSNCNESCAKNKNNNCSASSINKYSKDINTKFKKYLKLIENAQNNYVPCNVTKCNCYSSVIKSDLKKFKNGITENDIERVRSKGTKYQIINNKLYREENCMFPSRCAGIEHFILELLPSLPDMELIINTRDWPQIQKQYGSFGPVFSFSKTKDYHDIMYPAWAFWEGGPAISLYPRGIAMNSIEPKKPLYLYISEPTNFNVNEPAEGTKPNCFHDLVSEQQTKLNELKYKTIKENHEYLKEHPEVEAIIVLILRKVFLRQKPTNVVQFVAQYFHQSFYDIEDEIVEYLKKKGKKYVRSDRVNFSPSDSNM